MPLSELDELLECYFRLWTDPCIKQESAQDYYYYQITPWLGEALASLRSTLAKLLNHTGISSVGPNYDIETGITWIDIPDTNFQESSNKYYLRRKKND